MNGGHGVVCFVVHVNMKKARTTMTQTRQTWGKQQCCEKIKIITPISEHEWRVGGVVDVKKARMTMVHKHGKHKDDNKKHKKTPHLKHYQVREWITAGALLQHHTTTCSSMLATFTWKKVKGGKKITKTIENTPCQNHKQKICKEGHEFISVSRVWNGNGRNHAMKKKTIFLKSISFTLTKIKLKV